MIFRGTDHCCRALPRVSRHAEAGVYDGSDLDLGKLSNDNLDRRRLRSRRDGIYRKEVSVRDRC